MSFLAMPDPAAARRFFLARSGLMLSGAAVALLAGKDALAASTRGDEATDTDILNTALASEYEAVAAYQAGADSGLLQRPVLDLALKFQGHHKAHAEVLAGIVARLGGTAVSAKPKYDFPLATLKSQADVLRFAAGLEKGAVSAYVGAVPLFAERDLSRAAATILADEAMHWAVLRHALGEDPVPAAFIA